MESLLFYSERDAHLVASQLYGCQVEGNVVTFKQIDDIALKLAVSLAKVESPLMSGAYCSLPFPRHERECNEHTPRIYITCLTSYNAGILHGAFIDATQEPEEIQDDIDWILSWSPIAETELCDEWEIDDYDNFYGIHLSKHEDLEKVSAIAQAIDKHGSAMAAFIDWQKTLTLNPNIVEIAKQFDQYFCGRWESEEDFVVGSDEIENLFNWNEFEKQFSFWSRHVDWQSIARELFMSDYYSIRTNNYDSKLWGVWVFRN